MIDEKNLGYEVDVAAEIDTLRTDETRLRQVLLNLLSNAVKFTDSGSVVLRVRPSEQGGVRFEVADTGVGIADTEIDKIFEEFTQVDQSETREHGGAGLGLAISRKLVELLGGFLRVSSVVGEGTTFTVELPARPPAAWDLDGEEGGD